MSCINERFKQLRIAYKKKQGEWGDILGITKSGVSDIERGKRSVTEQHLIMLKNWSKSLGSNRINIDWLKTGSGDMFTTIPYEEELAMYIEELLYGEEATTKNAIKAFLAMYMKMNESSRAVMDKAIDDWLAEMKRMGD